MLHANQRKLALSGWLQKHGEQEYRSALKLQKFLFFYEAICKAHSESCDFSGLKGYENGPVFSAVWGDYTYEKEAFCKETARAYMAQSADISNEHALQSHFLVSILSEQELSKLTHEMNIWKAQTQRIRAGEQQVELKEDDFNAKDCDLIRLLEQMYPVQMIEDTNIYHIETKNFLIKKENAHLLTKQHLCLLQEVAKQEELMNPIFVDFDEEGRLAIA